MSIFISTLNQPIAWSKITVKGELKADSRAMKTKGYNNIHCHIIAELVFFSSMYSPLYIFKYFPAHLFYTNYSLNFNSVHCLLFSLTIKLEKKLERFGSCTCFISLV